jgi:hypothetical protein
MPAVNPVTRRDLIGLALVLVVATILRLGEPGMVEFLHDEAYLSLLAQDLVAGGPIPVTGIPSSVGIPNPPISLYVMAIPYALSSSPLIATLFIAVLNVAGVGLLWLMGHRYLRRNVALLTGLAYAVNPWAVLYSRKIWAQDFHTPFVLLGLLVGLHGFVEGKRWAQALCLPLLFLAFQIHFAAWALLPLYPWLLWRGRNRLSHGALTLSVILAVLTLAPFLIGLSRTIEQEPYRISNAFDGQGRVVILEAAALVNNVRMATGVGLETWVAPEQQAHLLASLPNFQLLWFVAIGLATLAGLIAVWAKPEWRVMSGFVNLWVLAPLVVFTPTWTRVYPHYFTASIPALSLAFGMGVVSCSGYLKALLRFPLTASLVLAVLGLVLLTQALWWRGLLRYVDVTNTPAGYGTPIRYLLDVRDALAESDDVIVVSDGFEALYDQEPAAWPVLLRDTATCVRTITGDALAVFPNHPFAVLVAPNAPDNPVDGLYETNNPLALSLRPEAGAYTLHHFERAPDWSGPPLNEIVPVRFDNGAHLTRYRLDADRMYLEWQLPGPVSKDYHYFGHFLDADGERVGQRDNLLWPGRFWCEGDRLITWADVDLPGGVEMLRIGLYALEGGGVVNSSVLDDAGNPVASWADIALQQ